MNDVSGHLFLNDDFGKLWDASSHPPGPDALSGVRRSLSSKNSQKWRLVGTGMAGKGTLEIWEEWNQEKGKERREVEGSGTRLSVRLRWTKMSGLYASSTHGKRLE